MINEKEKKKLVDEAKDALGRCYPKDSPHKYSAAVLTANGAIYSAGSYGSFTASFTLYGEQSALAHAASHGEEVVRAIAVASNEENKQGEFTAPCHMCKQLLWESRLRSGEPLPIILSNDHGETKEVLIDELMLLPWPKNSLVFYSFAYLSNPSTMSSCPAPHTSSGISCSI